jgi:hypothetical protein
VFEEGHLAAELAPFLLFVLAAVQKGRSHLVGKSAKGLFGRAAPAEVRRR